MTPLGEAVRLIDGKERNLHLLHGTQEHAAAETLRCHVNEFVFTTLQGGDAVLLLAQRQRAVDHGGRDAAALQGIHLILHQRDQRADHDGHTFHHHRRKLVTQRLSTARGHDHQGVTPRQDVRHHGFLTIQEFAKAEVLPQSFAGIVDRGGFGVWQFSFQEGTSCEGTGGGASDVCKATRERASAWDASALLPAGLNHPAAQKQAKDRNDGDGNVDDEADLPLRERAKDDADDAAGQRGPKRPAEEGNQAGDEKHRTDKTDENRDDLHSGGNEDVIRAQTNRNLTRHCKRHERRSHLRPHTRQA